MLALKQSGQTLQPALTSKPPPAAMGVHRILCSNTTSLYPPEPGLRCRPCIPSSATPTPPCHHGQPHFEPSPQTVSFF
ncbi:hypothetical protein BKA80DRAFT_72553 [Phyllosticta citrichinensis]